MNSLRDTTADAAAALHADQARERQGYNDPSVTLLGQDAKAVRVAMDDAYALLLDLEERTKIFREKQRIRTVRVVLGAAKALVPEARAQSVPEARSERAPEAGQR